MKKMKMIKKVRLKNKEEKFYTKSYNYVFNINLFSSLYMNKYE